MNSSGQWNLAPSALDALLGVIRDSLEVAWAGVVQAGGSASGGAEWQVIAGQGTELVLPTEATGLGAGDGALRWAVGAGADGGSAADSAGTDEVPARFWAAMDLPGRADCRLVVADPAPRPAFEERAQRMLARLTRTAGGLLAPAAEGGAAAQTYIRQLERDLDAAQAALGVAALTDLDLSLPDLLLETMRVVGRATEADWSGVVAVHDEVARTASAWQAPGLEAPLPGTPREFSRAQHPWLWELIAGPGPVALDDLPPAARITQGGQPMLGFLALPLGSYGGVQYALAVVRLRRHGGWSERDHGLLRAVTREIRHALDRQQELEELQRVQSELHHTLDHAPLILWATDERGNFTQGRGQGLEVLGLPSGALIGRSALGVYRDVPEVVSALTRALAGEALTVTTLVAGRHYENHYRPRRTGGTRRGVLCLSYDVTDRVRAEQDARGLLHLSALLDAAGDLLTVAPDVLGTLRELLKVDWLVLWERRGERLLPLALHGDPPDAMRAIQQGGLEVASFPNVQRALRGQAVHMRYGTLPQQARRAGLTAGALVPVWLDDPEQAVLLGAYCREDHAFSATQLELISAAARTLRAAVVRERRLSQLTTETRTDILTSLGNRRALEADLGAGLAAADRSGQPYGVVSMDVDGLKPVNDRRGHAAGDALLVCLGQEVQRVLPDHARLYRLGGDEFVALLPQVGADALPFLRRQLRRAVQALHAAGFPEVDISVGLATAPEDGRTPEALLGASDDRLYRDKAGRPPAREGVTPHG